MTNQHSSACSKRQAFNLFVLREVYRRSISLCSRNCGGIANRQPADLSGCRQIALHQSGRHSERASDVVKTVAGVVGGQHRVYVDFEREQIAYRVRILRPVETEKTWRSWIRFGRR